MKNKKQKPKEDTFGKDYVRMWNAIRGIAECPDICGECRKKAEDVLKIKYDEDRKKHDE